MCGITGWVDFNLDISNNADILNNMYDTLSKRGPDEEGKWISKNALLGHRRLCVIDPEGGKQPMIREFGEKKYVITYNGELYNTDLLKKELISKGYEFYTNCDTEVVLISYVEWKNECVEHFNGIFAFGIWDNYNKILFLARDRFGVKPLFYTHVNSSIIFASEIKAILAHPDIEAKVCKEGLLEIFGLGPARTPGHGIFKDINEVKPAHTITFVANREIHQKYWKIESFPHEDNKKKTIEKLSYLLKDAIQRQLVSDVPLCTFLSGGLDSSGITALAAKWFMEKKGLQLDTFSIDYENNEKFFKKSLFQPDADNFYIKIMSDTFNTRHHNIILNNFDLYNALKESVEAKDLPGMADIDSSLLLFCRQVKKECSVALSGECADEIFGGYPWFLNKKMFYSNTFPWAGNIDLRLDVMSRELKESIDITQYIKERYNETLMEVPYLKGENKADKRRREIFYLNIVWFMSTLLDRKDRMSMASGLEVRVPYCDHRLLQYVWNIPWKMKMYKKREKGILRKAFENILPFEVLYRKKSPYPKTHNPVYEDLVKNELLRILDSNDSPVLSLIDKNKLLKLINSPSDYSSPWFGQLMAAPQMYAYIIQINYWLLKYNISLSF